MPPSRVSHAHALAAQANNAASAHRLLEKKKEYEAVAALERASALFVKRIEALADDGQIIADAGQVHGQVLEQWPNMFRILGLFLANRQRYAAPEASPTSFESVPGERLVRIPLDDVQAGNA
ncbi:hypothetical protein HD554DRAFT_2015498 [Boletus coccyginus]|nr:hypothetical protein HD554DRAFT_2015498 [Boletus coccyginus]